MDYLGERPLLAFALEIGSCRVVRAMDVMAASVPSAHWMKAKTEGSDATTQATAKFGQWKMAGPAKVP
jgi:hypothetical protein